MWHVVGNCSICGLCTFTCLKVLLLIALSCVALRQAVADETASKFSVQSAYTATQKELDDLEEATITVCQELEGEGMQSGSSTISRLRH